MSRQIGRKAWAPELLLAGVLLAGAVATAQAAPVIYTGLDNSDLSGGGAHPNADAAAAAFALAAGTLATQGFEGFAAGALPAQFAVGPVTVTVTPLASNFTQISAGVGTFDTFPVGGDRYLESLTNAGSAYFSFGFDQGVRALGFYITDASDWVGAGPPITNLTIRLFSNSGDTQVNLFDGVDLNTVVNGNVGFFGAIDFAAPFSGFSISNPGPNPALGNGEDAIGIDNFTVAVVPLPASLPLLALAFLPLLRRQRR